MAINSVPQQRKTFRGSAFQRSKMLIQELHDVGEVMILPQLLADH